MRLASDLDAALFLSGLALILCGLTIRLRLPGAIIGIGLCLILLMVVRPP